MYIIETHNSLKGLFPSFNKHIWGLDYEDISFDGMVWRGVHIQKSFYFKGRNAVGLNQKFVHDCWRNGVMKLILFIGDNPPYREYLMDTPKKETIKWLTQQGNYEDRPSKFEGAKPMRIYYFRL